MIATFPTFLKFPLGGAQRALDRVKRASIGGALGGAGQVGAGLGVQGKIAAAAPGYLLDAIPGAIICCSNKKRKSDYAGYAARIANAASGGSLLDVGFSGDDFDRATAEAWLSGSQGYGEWWYDQVTGTVAAGCVSRVLYKNSGAQDYWRNVHNTYKQGFTFGYYPIESSDFTIAVRAKAWAYSGFENQIVRAYYDFTNYYINASIWLVWGSAGYSYATYTFDWATTNLNQWGVVIATYNATTRQIVVSVNDGAVGTNTIGGTGGVGNSGWGDTSLGYFPSGDWLTGNWDYTDFIIWKTAPGAGGCLTAEQKTVVFNALNA